MTQKVYNKLVRDHIPGIIEAAGGKPSTRILDDKEYPKSLDDKFGEEYQEFLAEPGLEELADMQEVILARADTFPGGRAELERIRAAKAEERGTFAAKILLEHVDE